MRQNLYGSSVAFSLLFLTLFFSSCLKDAIKELQDVKGIGADPYLSVPLINTHMGMKDIYNSYSDKAFIAEGSDHFLTFVYESRDSLTPRQFVNIPSLALNYDLGMDQGAIAQFYQIGSYSNSFSNYAVIQPGNKERIKKITVKKGSFIVDVSYGFKHKATIVFSYPSITKNGRSLVDTINFTYPPPAGQTNTVHKLIDVSGYDIDLSDGGISYNVIPYLLEMNIVRNPLYDVTTSDRVVISEKISIDEYSFVKGYLGKFEVLTYSTDESLDIFDKQADGKIFIKDPKIRVTVDNGIGMPITAKVSNLRIKTGKGDIYPVTVDKFKDTFTFDYPNINQVGQVIEGGFTVDHNNSNIDTVLSRGPQRVMYDLQFTANLREDDAQDNFLTDQNVFVSNANIELPLELKVTDYQLINDNALDWKKPPPEYTIDWAKISAYFENTFPLSSTVQIYFAKDSVINSVDSFAVVDSLYLLPILIPASTVDINGTFVQPTIVTNETVMEGEKYNRLTSIANRYVIVARTNTSFFNTSQPFVKVYSYQGLDFKIGVEVKGKYRKTF